MQASDFPYSAETPVKLNGQTVFTNYHIVYPEGRFSFISKQMRDNMLVDRPSFQDMRDMGYVADVSVGEDLLVTS